MRRTYEICWRTRQGKQDRSTDRAGAPRHVTVIVTPDAINLAGPNSTDKAPSELRCDVARYRGVAHPLYFTGEVMDHEFPEGFKPVNIESYDGTTDPAVWIEDFLLHIHMARGDDLHAIK